MKTVLAFDFGTKSIGVAVGQTITATASPLAAIRANEGIPDWQDIIKLVEQWQPDSLVVGLPLNMDGTEQELTRRARKFANRLANQTRLQVHHQDERLSTVDAKARLFELGGYKKLSKDKVDSVSACLIFESWCENNPI
ncbi:Holliday junction resolvase RuvX [Glaciecola sp. 1036]|uniref:Holliday junction resolvase RuvX n=1 Tax=Alteromonadaceae TaxID=72275 RepID=UPI003CFBD790